MRPLSSLTAMLLATLPAFAEDAMFDDFSAAADRWSYVADGVMGGVSQGGATFSEGTVRLTGQVSTDNNGGFIQVRREIEGGLPADTQGLRLSVRGNGETYYVFLRTEGLARVWHSYRHAFTAPEDWTEVTLDLADFAPSHADMPATFTPDQLIRIGLVAYGRDQEANLTVRSIELF